MTQSLDANKNIERYYRNICGYHELVEEKSYESYVVPPELLLRFIRRHGLIVDIAGGSGINAQILGLDSSEYACVDISFHGLGIVAEKRRGMPVQADVGELPIRNDSVDVVLCSWSLEHITNPALVLDEMIRIVKPGGRIIIWGPNWDNIFRKDFPQFVHKDKKYVRRMRAEIFIRMVKNEFFGFRYHPYINTEVAALANPVRYISGDTDAVHCVLCQETVGFFKSRELRVLHLSDFSELTKHIRNDMFTRIARRVLAPLLPVLSVIPLVRWFVLRFPVVVEKPVS